MKKKTTDSTKKKGKKKKVAKVKETPVWGDPDCKSFSYHPVTGKPLNPFPNLREQESIIPFFSERVEIKRQELESKKKKEQEEAQAGSLYKPINIAAIGGNKEENQEGLKPKPKKIVDLHRFEWMNKESWIRCRLRQRGWSYNDMFLNVQCSWTLLRLKMEIKKHLFEGSLLTDNILIYKNDLSKQEKKDDEKKNNNNNDVDDDENNDQSATANNETTNNNNNSTNNSNDKTSNDEKNEDELAIFSKNQEYTDPLYKLFPRIRNLKSFGSMIPFEEGFTNCDDNEYPVLIIGQRPFHIYEPPPPPPPPPKEEKKKKKKKGTETKKKTATPTKKKKVVKKKKKEVEETPPPPEEIDPNAPHEPNDSELLDMKDENIQIYREPNQILKNPDQYLYIYFDVNSPFVPS